MSIKAKIEAIIYAAEEPVSADQVAAVLREAGMVEQVFAYAAGGATEPAEETGETPDASSDTAPEAAPVNIPTDEKELKAAMRSNVRAIIEELIAEYDAPGRGMELRNVAGGYRITTKPEHHDVVRGFAKSLKPPIRLSLQALETLAVIAYKQPVTAPEISEIRGVDSSGVLATLLDRKLITTAGRKQVIGRPILYKTTREFLMRFGLKDTSELPSMEEFEKMTTGQEELFDRTPVADATGVPDVDASAASAAGDAVEEEPSDGPAADGDEVKAHEA